MLPTRNQETGKFCSALPEALDPKPINVKLPPSMKRSLKKNAGSDISAWVREAIAEKLQREENRASA